MLVKLTMLDRMGLMAEDPQSVSVFKYLDLFYNRQQLHQSLGYNTPSNSKPRTPRQ